MNPQSSVKTVYLVTYNERDIYFGFRGDDPRSGRDIPIAVRSSWTMPTRSSFTRCSLTKLQESFRAPPDPLSLRYEFNHTRFRAPSYRSAMNWTPQWFHAHGMNREAIADTMSTGPDPETPKRLPKEIEI